MTKFTCELIKPSHTFALHNGSKQVGLLDFNGPVMTFEGDADESAKVFFDFVAERFAQSKKRQWVSLTEWEREAIAVECGAMSADWLVFMEAVEMALKEKNT